MMRLASCLLLALAIGQVAAWDCPGGIKGADQVTGYSPFFGIKDTSKPLTYVDQTSAWKKFGPITKINAYYSYTYGCIQGFKVTYGYDSQNAQLLGIEKGLAEKSIKLSAYEHVTKVEVKAEPNKCIQWLQLSTNHTKTLAIGNDKSTAPSTMATVNRKAGYLAAIRGWQDAPKGGLQQLQFVWGVAVCPEPPAPKPAPVPLPSPEPTPEPTPEPESPAPTGGPDEPAPSPAPEPEPLCPPVKAKCDTTAPEGGGAFCPAITPFTTSQCTGGCCVSAGKCKKPLCGFNGLGAEVFAKDLFCWGTNKGFLHNKFNRCKNLACKLAVPGCIGDVLSGACVGTVTALSDDVDDGAKQWVGYPCLQPIPAGLPVDALGHWDINGAYANKLWTICNCKATKAVPGYDSASCKGPLCELFKKPEFPSLNFGLPKFDLPDVGKLIDSKLDALGNITELFKPNITIPHLPALNLKSHLDELKAHLNGTAASLSGPLRQALLAKLPTFTLNLTKPEVPTLSLNIPHPDLNLADLLPSLDLSKLGADKPAGLTVFNVSQLASLGELHTLDGLLKAFDVAGPKKGGAAAKPAP